MSKFTPTGMHREFRIVSTPIFDPQMDGEEQARRLTACVGKGFEVTFVRQWEDWEPGMVIHNDDGCEVHIPRVLVFVDDVSAMIRDSFNVLGYTISRAQLDEFYRPYPKS